MLNVVFEEPAPSSFARTGVCRGEAVIGNGAKITEAHLHVFNFVFTSFPFNLSKEEGKAVWDDFKETGKQYFANCKPQLVNEVFP